MSRPRRTTDFTTKGSWRDPRDVRHVEVYSDASFAPSAGQCKSVQGHLGLNCWLHSDVAQFSSDPRVTINGQSRAHHRYDGGTSTW